MVNMNRLTVLCAVLFMTDMACAIVPNRLVSGGLRAYTGASTTDYLTDGYLTNWKSSSEREIALNVGEGPVRLRVNWESYGDCAWATNYTTGCSHSGIALANFKIMTSSNSTNGIDGDWVEAASIEDNPVMARGVEIDFAGKSWFKFVSSGEVGQLLEIEAFDMSRGGTDTWFFMGTSISQMGIKQQDTDSTTAQLIHARFPEYTPAMMRGGIGCINSTEVVQHIDDYLRYAGNVKFWAIEMGTNDAWGGGDWNLSTYVSNMQTIIDSAKSHGITPVIARIIATDSARAGWQVNQKFLDAVDKLAKDNALPAGPDFFSFFKEHPEMLASDGVHPNADTRGGQAMHRLWAEALAPLYAASDPNAGDSAVVNPDSTGNDSLNVLQPLRGVRFAVPQVEVSGRAVAVSGVAEMSRMTVLDATGHVVWDSRLDARNSSAVVNGLAAGRYYVAIRSGSGLFKTVVSVK